MKIKMNPKTVVIHPVKSNHWQLPFILGIIYYIIAIFLNETLFYIHYYLIIAGLISFIGSFRKYAKIGEGSFQFFIGIPLFRKQIEIPWREIHNIAPQNIERLAFADAGGGRGGLPFKFKHQAVVVNLINKLSSETKMLIRERTRLHFFTEGIKIADEDKAIVFLQPPKAGFKQFLSDLSRYTSVEKIDTVKDETKLEKVVIEILFAIAIFVITALLLFFLYFIKS